MSSATPRAGRHQPKPHPETNEGEGFLRLPPSCQKLRFKKSAERFSLLSDRQSLLIEFKQSRPVALGRALIKDR